MLRLLLALAVLAYRSRELLPNLTLDKDYNIQAVPPRSGPPEKWCHLRLSRPTRTFPRASEAHNLPKPAGRAYWL